MSDQLAEEKNTVTIKQMTISELEECFRKKDFEYDHLKSKAVDCTVCQNLQVHVEELKSVNETLNLLIEELYNSEKDVILSLQTQLKETTKLVVRFSDEKYCALKKTESLRVEIKSLQTENKVLKSGESELSEKIDQMKSQVLELSEKLQISDQEMKQQIILFEEDK
ncbi:hypothetical protein Tco_0368803 [Tanacetum coccineum]